MRTAIQKHFLAYNISDFFPRGGQVLFGDGIGRRVYCFATVECNGDERDVDGS